MSGIRVASGHLFFFYAYDAGFEIALDAARAETLELIIILLIAIEIVMGLLRWLSSNCPAEWKPPASPEAQ